MLCMQSKHTQNYIYIYIILKTKFRYYKIVYILNFKICLDERCSILLFWCLPGWLAYFLIKITVLVSKKKKNVEIK